MTMLTADTITDEQIRDFPATLAPDHYAVQWCLDAQWDRNARRRRNARHQLAEILNARRSASQ